MSTREEDREFLRYRDSRDPQAMARVFDLTASRLLLLAMHVVRDATEAEDLVQTTFLQAIQDADSFESQGSGSVLAWLMGILTHRGRDAQRIRRRRRERAAAGGRFPDQDSRPGPLEQLQGRDALEHVQRALDALPPRYRPVVILRLVHGLKAVEIAHSLDRSPETVRTQLRRGLGMLRERLPRSLAVPSALTLLAGEGLAAVRVQVVKAAASKVAIPSVAGATGFTLGAIAMKKFLLVTAAVLGLAFAGYLVWPDASGPYVAGRRAGADAGSGNEAPIQSPVPEVSAPQASVEREPLAGAPLQAGVGVVVARGSGGGVVRGAEVYLVDGRATDTPPARGPIGLTDRNGACPIDHARLPGQTPGRRLLMVRKPGYVPVAREIPRRGETVTAVLHVGHSLYLMCHDHSGGPLENVAIALSRVVPGPMPLSEVTRRQGRRDLFGYPNGSSVYCGVTDAHGGVTLSGLPAGRYVLAAEHRTHVVRDGPKSGFVDLPAKRTVVLTLAEAFGFVLDCGEHELLSLFLAHPSGSLETSPTLRGLKSMRRALRRKHGDRAIMFLGLPANPRQWLDLDGVRVWMLFQEFGSVTQTLRPVPISRMRPVALAVPKSKKHEPLVRVDFTLLDLDGQPVHATDLTALPRGSRRAGAIRLRTSSPSYLPRGVYRLSCTDPRLRAVLPDTEIDTRAGRPVTQVMRWTDDVVRYTLKCVNRLGRPVFAARVSLQQNGQHLGRMFFSSSHKTELWLPTGPVTATYYAFGYGRSKHEFSVTTGAGAPRDVVLVFPR